MNQEIESPLISRQLPMPTKRIRFDNIKLEKPLIALCIGNLITNMCMQAFPPVFPPLAQDLDLESGYVGIIFGGLPMGSFLFSIAISIMLAKWGRKKVIIISIILYAICQVSFSLISYVKDKYVFFTLNLLCRIALGGARSGFSSTLFAYIPMLWPDEVQKTISFTETFSGIGLITGPLLSGVLTTQIGYPQTFYIFGGLCILLLIPSIIMLPQDKPIPPKHKLLSLKRIFKEIRVIAQFGLIMALVACVCYVNPLLTNHLATYGLDTMDSSYIFTAGTLMYILTLLSMRPIIQRQPKTFILSIGLFLICLDCEIIGPEPLVGFPNKWYMPLIGLAINGIGQCFCILPTIPYFIELVLPLYPNQLQGVTDMASGLLVQAYSLGLFMGPMLSGFVFQAFSDTKTCSKQDKQCQNSANQYGFYQDSRVFFYISLFFFLFFMTIGQGYRGWIDKFRNKQSQVKVTYASQNLLQSLQRLDNEQQQQLQNIEENQDDNIQSVKSEIKQ